MFARAIGCWSKDDQEAINAWMRQHIKKAKKHDKPLVPVVQDLKELIENDAKTYMWFAQMFDEVPTDRERDPAGRKQLRDYNQLLQLLNHLLHRAPDFDPSCMVGTPLNAVLDWPMATEGGFAAFLDDTVNRKLKAILNEWGRFLRTPESAHVLHAGDKGWFCPRALEMMPDFAKRFECDPAAEHWGFASWDDFFTRRFRPGVRPVADPDDDRVITNSCESAPYRLATDVQETAEFWVKSQPYSLRHMLAGDARVDQFVGGTVYQAFLSATSYHRWHAPVSGTVVDIQMIDGTYFAECPLVGYDDTAPNNSQGYICHLAARGIIFIQADNPAIGLMAIMYVGMVEVSTCEFTVKVGGHVTKGQQLGMFHFGGSTHCVFYRRGVSLKWDLHGQAPSVNASNLLANSRVAVVAPAAVASAAVAAV